MILSSLIFVVCFLAGSPAFGQGIELTDVHTSPSQIHVGDSFQINATLVNNSPGTINFRGGCQSPLSTIFEKNVVIGQAMGCFAIFSVDLKPGENTTVIGPSGGILYTATSSGTANANVTFSYQTENKSENAISKLFAFDISEGTPVPEFPFISVLIFTIATMSAIVLMVSRKNNNLFKL